MTARKTNLITDDGLAVYDLDPHCSGLIAVAGPHGYEPESIIPFALPPGFRWVDASEWSRLCQERADDLSSRND